MKTKGAFVWEYSRIRVDGMVSLCVVLGDLFHFGNEQNYIPFILLLIAEIMNGINRIWFTRNTQNKLF